MILALASLKLWAELCKESLAAWELAMQTSTENRPDAVNNSNTMIVKLLVCILINGVLTEVKLSSTCMVWDII